MSGASVRSTDGIDFGYRDEGRGDPTVVLLHGWAMDRHIWDDVIPRLATRFRIVAPDLPGHGASGSGRHAWTMEAFAEDVRALVEALDLPRVILVGHSMSGPVAVEASRRLGSRVVGIVPVDTLTSVDRKPPPESLEGLFRSLEADYRPTIEAYSRQWLLGPSTEARVVDAVLERTTGMDPVVSLAVLRSLLSFDARPALREVRVPIVAVNGDRFPTDLAAARRYAPQFELIVAPATSHYPMLEDAARFGQLLESALDRVLTRRG